MSWTPDRYFDLNLSPAGDGEVCSRCFKDYAVRRFIRKEGSVSDCTYCGRKGVRCLDVNDLVLFLRDGLLYEYEDAANSVGYCSAEGGYLLPTMETSELLEEVFEDEELGVQLLEDIDTGLPMCPWVKKDPYGDPLHDEWFFDWKRFCKLVKHETRYFFLRPKTGRNVDLYESEPYTILRRLGKSVRALRMVRTLPRGTEFIRVRCHKKKERYTSATSLAAPPMQHAKYSNRMSPAGVPMFYGAKDIQTAIAETFDPGSDKHTIITAGHFELLRPFRVLDLTCLPRVPSLFDKNQRHKRDAVLFLRRFISDISKRIEKDGREHIDYVPTQIVTEYFRRSFKVAKAHNLDGLIYPSAQRKGGVSCVLFVLNEEAVDSSTSLGENHPAKIRLTDVERILPKQRDKLMDGRIA